MIMRLVLLSIFFAAVARAQPAANPAVAGDGNETTTTTPSGFNKTGPPFDKCTVEEYYSALTSAAGSVAADWPRDDVAALLVETHRKVLPNTGVDRDDDDIIKALIDLFPGKEELQESDGQVNASVHLVYRNVSRPAYPAFTLTTWMREDFWPIKRGASRTSPALTDVHGKQPADRSVQEKKAELFFGMCGTVEDDAACSRPATNETAPTTEQDNKVFAPPVDVRGDIARALFYTQLRYEKSLGLQLTDCAPFADGEFGYLSQLLQWHEEDPVSQVERDRNDRICSRWQGNRNVFVDYPELAAEYWGPPDEILAGTRKYSKCTAKTDAPTATHNACQIHLQPGDIPVFLMNSDDPDQVVFYPIEDIPASVGKLYLTDRAWTGTAFVEAEGDGVAEFIIPDDGMASGVVFGYGPGSDFAENWTVLGPAGPGAAAPAADGADGADGSGGSGNGGGGGGSFDISTEGEVLFVYCINADGNPHFVTAFSFNGAEEWKPRGLPVAEYTSNTSALPARMDPAENGDKPYGAVLLPHHHNYVYTGPQAGFKDTLLKEFINPDNYEGFDEKRIEQEEPTEASRGGALPAKAASAAAFIVAIATAACSATLF